MEQTRLHDGVKRKLWIYMYVEPVLGESYGCIYICRCRSESTSLSVNLSAVLRTSSVCI